MLWSKPDSHFFLFFFFFSSFILVEWIAAVSLAAGAAAVGYLAYKKFLCKDKCCKAMVNLHIQKDNPKVVHAFDMEDLGDKAVYCRCWRSKKVRINGPVSFMCMHLSIKLLSNCFIQRKLTSFHVNYSAVRSSGILIHKTMQIYAVTKIKACRSVLIVSEIFLQL